MSRYCEDCGHVHTGVPLGRICVGCPCPERPGDDATCGNCDGTKCMACRCREVHDRCVDDCPDCCAPLSCGETHPQQDVHHPGGHPRRGMESTFTAADLQPLLDLHRPHKVGGLLWCVECVAKPWPCATVAALPAGLREATGG